MPTPIQLIPGTFPSDCWPSPQEYNVAIFSLARAFLDENFPGIYVGPTSSPPPVNQRDRVWVNSDNQLLYQYFGGAWKRKYQWAAGSPFLMLWTGSPTDLNTVDGGSSGAVGDSTGPLWEIVSTYAGRVPVGVGLVPGSNPAATITAVGDTQDSLGNSGEYKHVLVPGEIAHMHGVGTDGGIDDPPTMLARAWSSIKNFTRRINDLNTSGSSGWHDDTTSLQSGTMGTTEPFQDTNFPNSDGHLNMQPYIGTYFIRRTARIYVFPPY